MSSYRENLPGQYPTTLRDPWGAAWGAAEGAAYDAVLDAAKRAVRFGMLLLAPSSALAYHGAEARIARAPGEGSEPWRARIGGAWESWSWVGTRYGIALNTALLGYGTPSVFPYRELPPDADADRWARVVVVFRGFPAWDAAATWDGADVWDDPRLADAIETATELTWRPQLRAVLRQWVNGRDVVDRVVIAYGSLLWDLDANWDGDDLWDVGDGYDDWQSTEWDSAEAGAVWDAPLHAWDAFC